MKKIASYLPLLFFAWLVTASGSWAHELQTPVEKYQCPMKCEGEKTYDKPGNCPVCGMALKKIMVETEIYRCPMKCEGEKTYDKPGKCPVCGMALKKIMVETEIYRCPMKCEGEKTYDKPGNCPVCGMALKKVTKPVAKKSNVKIAGAMMNVMQKGQLGGTISLDTLSGKTHLYGLGPVEYLKGELLLLDSKSYLSAVKSKKAVSVEETYQVKAPFFVYAQVDKWTETALPDSVQTIPQLENYLEQATKNHSRPFAFRLKARFDKAVLHIVNLPAGTAVHSPEDTRRDALTLPLKKQDAEILGFFSTGHKGVFTHHDSNVHIHLITADKKKMGHLDSMQINKGSAKLYIAEE